MRLAASTLARRASSLGASTSALSRPVAAAGLQRLQPLRVLSQAAAPATADADAADAAAASKPDVSSVSIRKRLLSALESARSGQGDFDSVLDEYEHMVESEVVPDIISVNAIVEAKAYSAGSAQAKEVLQALLEQHKSLEPNSWTYLALMASLAKAADTKLAFAYYDELLADGITPTAEVYNQLITVATAAKDFAAAEGVFGEMREKGVTPKGQTYLKYIFGAIKAEEAEKAYQMLRAMETQWRVPDVRDYRQLLYAFRKASHSEGQMRCVKGLLQDTTQRADARSFGGKGDYFFKDLIKDAQKRRKPEEVLQLATMLEEAGMPLDAFCEIGVVFAHLHLEQTTEAFGRLTRLLGKGGRLPEPAREAMVAVLSKQASAVDDAYYLLETRRAEGAPVPLAAVNIVIDACAEMGDLDRAFATWAELEALGLTPDAGTYNGLLHTCIRTRELGSGRRLLGRMAADEVAPDEFTFMHECSLHIMSRENARAFALLGKCKEQGLTPPGRMYVALINVAIRSNQDERARELLEEMGAHHKVSDGLRKRVEDPSAWAANQHQQQQRGRHQNDRGDDPY